MDNIRKLEQTIMEWSRKNRLHLQVGAVNELINELILLDIPEELKGDLTCQY